MIRAASPAQLEEEIVRYMKSIYFDDVNGAEGIFSYNINTMKDEKEENQRVPINIDKKDLILGRLKFPDSLATTLKQKRRIALNYREQVNGVPTCPIMKNNIAKVKATGEYRWEPDIAQSFREIEEEEFKLKSRTLTQQERQTIIGTINNLKQTVELFEEPERELFVIHEDGAITINQGHDIFVVAQWIEDLENRTNVIFFRSNLVEKITKELLAILRITMFGDIRPEKSGNPVLTLLQEVEIRDSTLKTMNNFNYNSTNTFWIPVALIPTIITSAIKNNRIDRNLIISQMSTMTKYIWSLEERTFALPFIMMYVMPKAIEHLEATREAEETAKKHLELVERTMRNRRMIHKANQVMKYFFVTCPWKDIWRHIRVFCFIGFVLMIWSLFGRIMESVQVSASLPQGEFVVYEAQDYASGMMARKPRTRKNYVKKGDAGHMWMTSQYKWSRADMYDFGRTDLYNTTSINNMRAGILDRMLVDNRTDTTVVSNQAFNLSRKILEPYLVGKTDGGVVVRTAGLELNGQFGKDLEEKANSIADYLLEHSGVEDIAMITKDEFELFCHNKSYSIGQINKMLREVPTMLVDENDYNSVPHFWAGFVKQEEYFKMSGPRNICACSSVVKMIGVALEKMQHAYFSRPECIKTVTFDQRPDILQERYAGEGYLYQTDHSAFEGAQLDDVRLKTEYVIFKKIFPNLWNLMNVIWRSGKSEDDHSSKDVIRLGKPGSFEWWIVDSMRMSGSPDTSLGNTIVNECVTYALLKKQGITDYVGTFEGDDALIMTKQPVDIDKLFEDSQKAGFKLKLDVRENVWSAGFLSTYWDPETKVTFTENYAKDLYGVFTHYGNQMKKLGEASYLKAKMLSLLIRNPGNELFYAIWKKTEELCKEKMKLVNNWWNRNIICRENKTEIEIDKDVIVIRDIDVEKFLRREQFGRILYDIDIKAIEEELVQCQTLQQLYDVVSYVIRLIPKVETGMNYSLVYDNAVHHGKREPPGGNDIFDTLRED